VRGIARRVLISLAPAFCLILAGEALAGPCKSPDNVTRVTGGSECLVIHTFGAAAGNRTLVVFIHGDGTRGGPSDYLDKSAERVVGGGVTAVALIRPGYYDSHDAISTGTSYRHAGDGYRDGIIAAVAAAIDELKGHHGARRVVLVGTPAVPRSAASSSADIPDWPTPPCSPPVRATSASGGPCGAAVSGSTASRPMPSSRRCRKRPRLWH